jgi:hypothetical protein
MMMTSALRLAPLAAVVLLAACGTARIKPTPPSVVIPGSLSVPGNESLVRTLWADGVQIYECRAKAAGAAFPEWVLVGPDARLVDSTGMPAGHHYAGPTWEAVDGSKVVGVVKARSDAPQPGTVAWLLLTTHSTGKPGLFANITSIQRVATEGGAMPATGCGTATVGKQASVPYKAQYAQYAPTM